MELKYGTAVFLFIFIGMQVAARHIYPPMSNISYILHQMHHSEESTYISNSAKDPVIVIVNENNQVKQKPINEFDDVFFMTGDDGILDDIYAVIYDDDAKEEAKARLYRSMLRVNDDPENTEEKVEEEKREVIKLKLRATCEARLKCEAKCDKEKSCLKKCLMIHDKYNLC